MKASSIARGYDRRHRAQRRRWATLVEQGDGYCAEPLCLHVTRWIVPGEPWDLAHNRVTGEWRGPAHASCNRSEGASHGNRLRGAQRGAQRRSTRDW